MTGHDRFLSREACGALAARVAGFATGGGDTALGVETSWTGNLRWARNQVVSGGDVRDNTLVVLRAIRGASARTQTNRLDDAALEAAVRRAERLLTLQGERPVSNGARGDVDLPANTALWSDRTYAVDATARAAAMALAVEPVRAAGMHAAGYVEVSAHGRALLASTGINLYYPYTLAQYSVTVRAPNGSGSGWAGVDASDWTRLDVARLTRTALEKCLAARDPVAAEPGRYTAILEPQAAADFVAPMFEIDAVLDRQAAESYELYVPFTGSKRGSSKIGERVMDERLTITADPADPDAGFPPVSGTGLAVDAYRPTTWVEHGVLRTLAYPAEYAMRLLLERDGRPNSGAFHMTGGSSSVETMIASTKRGVLVTRLSNVRVVDVGSLLCTGFTRDGLWLIENGKVSKPIKNFRFAHPILAALNSVRDVGVPTRVFRPGAPTIVPALAVDDFNFVALSEAV